MHNARHAQAQPAAVSAVAAVGLLRRSELLCLLVEADAQ